MTSKTGRRLAEVATILSNRDLRILTYLIEHLATGTSMLSGELEEPARTMRRSLSSLVQRGLVQAEGTTTARAYSLALDADEGEE